MSLTIIAFLAAVLGPLTAYIVAVRRLSGKIATSDASELWKESAAIRSDYREQLAVAAERLRSLEARVEALEAENAQLRRQLEAHDRS